MLIRLLGEESEALSCTAYQPFTDVPDWALPYAAYAYSKATPTASAQRHSARR